MSEPIGDEQPTPADDGADDAADDVPQTLEQGRKLRSENRSLRNRLHELEADHEKLEADHEKIVTQLGAAQRRDVEREASKYLIDPSDVWRVDPDTSQAFIDAEFNEVVGDRVAEAAKAIIAAKPHLARLPSGPPPSNRPIEGLRPGASPPDEPTPKPTWSSAIRGGGA